MWKPFYSIESPVEVREAKRGFDLRKQGFKTLEDYAKKKIG